MNRDIAERLQTGERFLLDGATGSELQRRKVDLSHGISEDGTLGVWSATAMRDAPDQVRAVHEDYLRVGAQIVTTNRFWTNPGRLSLAGLADEWEPYTRLAGELAKHMYCGPVAAAAAIQLDVCSPSFLVQEFNGSSLHSDILKEPIRFENGFIYPPTDRGLGWSSMGCGRAAPDIEGETLVIA